jgi:hypothetical protein
MAFFITMDLVENNKLLFLGKTIILNMGVEVHYEKSE